MQKSAENRYYISILFLILSILLFIVSIGNSYKDNTNTNTNNSTTNSSIINSESNSSIWASDYTPLSDFDYYIEGNNIYLKEYNGESKKVKINSTYTIDNTNYTVISFSEGVFALNSVDSVILPDTLTSMPNHTFNSCGIKFIYIPASLQPTQDSYPFYKYFHDMEKIYYGGTEEQWHILTKNADRSEIDAREIIYNAKAEDLK